MIKDATVNRGAVAPATFLSGVARDPNSDSIVHGVLKLLFAPDVSLRCLDRSVSKQKLNLFEFAAALMADSGTGAPVMPHAALATMPNAGSCRIDVKIFNLARSLGDCAPRRLGIIREG
jgi:hypothetical protein